MVGWVRVRGGRRGQERVGVREFPGFGVFRLLYQKRWLMIGEWTFCGLLWLCQLPLRRCFASFIRSLYHKWPGITKPKSQWHTIRRQVCLNCWCVKFECVSKVPAHAQHKMRRAYAQWHELLQAEDVCPCLLCAGQSQDKLLYLNALLYIFVCIVLYVGFARWNPFWKVAERSSTSTRQQSLVTTRQQEQLLDISSAWLLWYTGALVSVLLIPMFPRFRRTHSERRGNESCRDVGRKCHWQLCGDLFEMSVSKHLKTNGVRHFDVSGSYGTKACMNTFILQLTCILEQHAYKRTQQSASASHAVQSLHAGHSIWCVFDKQTCARKPKILHMRPHFGDCSQCSLN